MCKKGESSKNTTSRNGARAVNSTGTINISTSSMKRVVLVLSIENSLIVTKVVIK